MAKFRCPRGHIISTVQSPLAGEHEYFPTVELTELARRLLHAVREAEGDVDRLGIAINKTFRGRLLYFCQRCGSLVMPDEDPPRSFLAADERSDGSP